MQTALPTIPLTKAEREDVEWAFGAMMDYWGAQCVADSRPGSYIAEPEGVTENDLTIPADALMPYIDGDTLILSNWSEVNGDLRYRIGEQLPCMADSAAAFDSDMPPQKAGKIAARCARLAEKIDEAMVAMRPFAEAA